MLFNLPLPGFEFDGSDNKKPRVDTSIVPKIFEQAQWYDRQPYFTQKAIAEYFKVKVTNISISIKRKIENKQIDDGDIIEMMVDINGKHYTVKGYSLDVVTHIAFNLNKIENAQEYIDWFSNIFTNAFQSAKIRQEFFDLINSPTSEYSRSGYIYVVTRDEIKYKIGLTAKYPERRFYQLTQQYGHIKVRMLFEVTDIQKQERWLHDYFAEKRIENTEWFYLTPDDIQWIESLHNEQEWKLVINELIPWRQIVEKLGRDLNA